MTKKIEKPWAVYKGRMFFPMNIGLITKEESNGTLYIKYVEGQFYSDECWDPNYVSRFETPGEAAKYFVKRRGGNLERELNKLSENFPKAMSAQSPPKCILRPASEVTFEEIDKAEETARSVRHSAHPQTPFK